MKRIILVVLAWCVGMGVLADAGAAEKPSYSGIHPHLAMFNNEGECGVGAVAPWAGRLWAVTYGPHLPNGSSDKLYEISDLLEQTIRPESIGGTPANRMIHRESQQLFIGPYAIGADGKVRAIPYSAMFGRHTATMRHLTDPAGKVYYATMEEGFYEVDVKSLNVRELFPDGNRDPRDKGGSLLPGYHGKGAYTGQGRIVYANNGETGPAALKRPDVPSGCLAQWDQNAWRVVRRNQFTDVTGPGGILGAAQPDSDPIWSIGWDHRSLILMLLDGGVWHAFRLPKASHCYDGAHGWNTEWPRIREIGEGDQLLMTMHGMFWTFPRGFAAGRTGGISPRATYLKVIGDFCRWNDRLVFGCDDTAKSEFLNKRNAKGNLAGPGQSQSNLWFTRPDVFSGLGEPLGRGAVWMDEPAKAGEWSDPFLVAGFARRYLQLLNGGDQPAELELAVDRDGGGRFEAWRTAVVEPGQLMWIELQPDWPAQWIKLRAVRDCRKLTAQFALSGSATRRDDRAFASLAEAGEAASLGGLIRARGDNKRTLALCATAIQEGQARPAGYYELDADMKLKRVDDAAAQAYTAEHTAIPKEALKVDAASAVYMDDEGKRWRLPVGDRRLLGPLNAGLTRIDREVTTERDLFHCMGTFYELPAQNAGGFGRIRPIATHQKNIMDYCSYRGLLVLTGLSPARLDDPSHVVKSEDGKAAVWVGAVDDLWQLGKPAGAGGPLKETGVKAGAPSDWYLMSGFDLKRLSLSHDQAGPVRMRVEIDLNGDGLAAAYRTFEVSAGKPLEHELPRGHFGYWIRVVCDQDCRATAWLRYE